MCKPIFKNQNWSCVLAQQGGGGQTGSAVGPEATRAPGAEKRRTDQCRNEEETSCKII